MTAQEDKSSSPQITLSEDEVSFLVSLLRDPSRPQPQTTQQLIDALRGKSVS
jgi:hypothetical protein